MASVFHLCSSTERIVRETVLPKRAKKVVKKVEQSFWKFFFLCFFPTKFFVGAARPSCTPLCQEQRRGVIRENFEVELESCTTIVQIVQLGWMDECVGCLFDELNVQENLYDVYYLAHQKRTRVSRSRL